MSSATQAASSTASSVAVQAATHAAGSSSHPPAVTSPSGSSAPPSGSGDQPPVSLGDVRIGPPSVNQKYIIQVKDMEYDANGLHGQIIVNGKAYQYAGDGKEPTLIMGGGTSDAQKRKSQKRRPE